MAFTRDGGFEDAAVECLGWLPSSCVALRVIEVWGLLATQRMTLATTAGDAGWGHADRGSTGGPLRINKECEPGAEERWPVMVLRPACKHKHTHTYTHTHTTDRHTHTQIHAHPSHTHTQSVSQYLTHIHKHSPLPHTHHSTHLHNAEHVTSCTNILYCYYVACGQGLLHGPSRRLAMLCLFTHF
jgi:hypothetical protein